MTSKLIILLIFMLLLSFVLTSKNSTLQLVHVIFRHGQRTVDPDQLYPNDPHNNVSYYPYGPGELTTVGQKQMYELGKIFRTRYNFFLDELYTPSMLKAISSYIGRSKTSLQLFLYGLFPLEEKYRFEPTIDWQPIPSYYVEKEVDELFTAAHNCPKFQEEIVRYVKTYQVAENDLALLKYIEEKSGKQMRSYFDVFYVLGTLESEHEWGLKLPEWTNSLYPNKLEELLFNGYQLMTANTELTKITAGTLLKQIIEDTLGKINNKPSIKQRKLVIYSAHDITIAAFLGALKLLTLERMPQYGAYLMVELHYINETYGFKLFYANQWHSDVFQLIMPNCEEFCSITKFSSIVKAFMPEPETCRPKPKPTGYSWVLFITCSTIAMFYATLFICLVKYRNSSRFMEKTTVTSEELRQLN